MLTPVQEVRRRLRCAPSLHRRRRRKKKKRLCSAFCLLVWLQHPAITDFLRNIHPFFFLSYPANTNLRKHRFNPHQRQVQQQIRLFLYFLFIIPDFYPPPPDCEGTAGGRAWCIISKIFSGVYFSLPVLCREGRNYPFIMMSKSKICISPV